MAGGRVAPPNVMYAVRTLFPLNVDVALFGPRAQSRIVALCAAHSVNTTAPDARRASFLRHIVTVQRAQAFCRTNFPGCVELAGTHDNPAVLHADLARTVEPVILSQSEYVRPCVLDNLNVGMSADSAADIMGAIHFRPANTWNVSFDILHIAVIVRSVPSLPPPKDSDVDL